jgi:TatD DNase family protein
MKQTLIDTHCHLDFPVFDEDRFDVLDSCREKHINSIVIPGVCRKDWQRILSLCYGQKMLYPALGLHPCFINHHHPDDLKQLSKACQAELLVAVGEIGLDYFFSKTTDKKNSKNQQGYYFSEQLQIANQFHLPVLIHARKSHDDVLRYLKEVNAVKGIVHAFSGSYEQACEYIKRGFKLGFGGAYTNPKAIKLRKLLGKLPLDAWVLETDAPDMSPIGHYGKRNSPEYLPEIALEFIKLYPIEVNADSITAQLYQNTQDIFSVV